MKQPVILVVDDEPSVLITYRMILEQNHYTVLPATSSEEARKQLMNGAIDLLLCDLSLETQTSGFDVIEYARKRRPGIPVLLLTGYATQDASDKAGMAGVPILFKPIDITEMLSTISALLRGSHEQRKASGS